MSILKNGILTAKDRNGTHSSVSLLAPFGVELFLPNRKIVLDLECHEDRSQNIDNEK